MAELKILDAITEEICKIRGVDLPYPCIKLILLSYLMYCCNSFDVQYKNENGRVLRVNGGSIIMCQKGTGKSRAMKVLKTIFECVEKTRFDRYEHHKKATIGHLLGSCVPVAEPQKKEIEEFYKDSGTEVFSIIDDPATSKCLCQVYAQHKTFHVNNLFFTIDEAGDRLFKDAFAKVPSIAAKEFLQSVNQLFDGYCGMGMSSMSKNEDIKSQHDIGANFIFISTAEFLKDMNVQNKFKSWLESGAGRRLLYVNCPPIDKKKVNRKRIATDFSKFKDVAKEIFMEHNPRYPLEGREISVSETLWNTLEQEGAGSGVTIDEEFLILNFCIVLAVWTREKEIKNYHWEYMVNLWKELKALSMKIVEQNTTNYDKICIFIKDYTERHSKKKCPLAKVKDYILRTKMCYRSELKNWMKEICDDFRVSNASPYLLDYNNMYAWIDVNYAYEDE